MFIFFQCVSLCIMCVIECVIILSISLLNCVSVACRRSKRPIIRCTSDVVVFCSYSYMYLLFIFVPEPFEGLKDPYITMFWCRRLVQPQLADGLQTGTKTLIRTYQRHRNAN